VLCATPLSQLQQHQRQQRELTFSYIYVPLIWEVVGYHHAGRDYARTVLGEVLWSEAVAFHRNQRDTNAADWGLLNFYTPAEYIFAEDQEALLEPPGNLDLGSPWEVLYQQIAQAAQVGTCRTHRLDRHCARH
jgi:hypothetical protein